MDDRKAGLVIWFTCDLNHHQKAEALRELAYELEGNELLSAGPIIQPKTTKRVGYFAYQYLDQPPVFSD